MTFSGLVLSGANNSLQNYYLPEYAEDGFLTAEEILDLDLSNTELVVLSACDTGAGWIRLAEGVLGFRRFLYFAGARTLIMSLWMVLDQQTLLLMTHFYNYIIDGQPRSKALHSAELDIKKDYPHPFFWAAFICQGDPGPIKNIKKYLSFS